MRRGGTNSSLGALVQESGHRFGEPAIRVRFPGAPLSGSWSRGKTPPSHGGNRGFESRRLQFLFREDRRCGVLSRKQRAVGPSPTLSILFPACLARGLEHETDILGAKVRF